MTKKLCIFIRGLQFHRGTTGIVVPGPDLGGTQVIYQCIKQFKDLLVKIWVTSNIYKCFQTLHILCFTIFTYVVHVLYSRDFLHNYRNLFIFHTLSKLLRWMSKFFTSYHILFKCCHLSLHAISGSKTVYRSWVEQPIPNRFPNGIAISGQDSKMALFSGWERWHSTLPCWLEQH